jgi:hypothetical protein
VNVDDDWPCRAKEPSGPVRSRCSTVSGRTENAAKVGPSGTLATPTRIFIVQYHLCVSYRLITTHEKSTHSIWLYWCLCWWYHNQSHNHPRYRKHFVEIYFIIIIQFCLKSRLCSLVHVVAGKVYKFNQVRCTQFWSYTLTPAWWTTKPGLLRGLSKNSAREMVF